MVDDLIGQIHGTFGTDAWSVRDLVAAAQSGTDAGRHLESALRVLADGAINERKIGRRLMRLRGQEIAVGGRRLQLRAGVDRHRHVRKYRLAWAAGPGAQPHAGEEGLHQEVAALRAEVESIRAQLAETRASGVQVALGEVGAGSRYHPRPGRCVRAARSKRGGPADPGAIAARSRIP